MEQSYFVPITAENGSRVWVPLNFEPKRKKFEVPQLPWMAICLSIGAALIWLGVL